MRQAESKGTAVKGQCLEILETTFIRRFHPAMYCHLKLSIPLDRARLQRAVSDPGKYVPEMFCVFDLKSAGFVDTGLSGKEVFVGGTQGCQWICDAARS